MHRSQDCPVVLVLAIAMLAQLVLPIPALAVPTLQLFIEGSTYDASTETWVFTGDSFRLWVLGEVGSYGTISQVKLTAAHATGLSGAISLVPALADLALLPFPDDPSLPPPPSLVASPLSALSPPAPCGPNGTFETIPCLGDGSLLANHGEYGSGVQWVEYLLGDLTLTDSPIGDFTQAVPDPLDPSQFPKVGQINAYDISASGFPAGTTIHFDAFNHIVQNRGRWKFVFAPFSHDALDQPSVPAPSPLLLLGAGGIALWGFRRLRRGG